MDFSIYFGSKVTYFTEGTTHATCDDLRFEKLKTAITQTALTKIIATLKIKYWA